MSAAGGGAVCWSLALEYTRFGATVRAAVDKRGWRAASASIPTALRRDVRARQRTGRSRRRARRIEIVGLDPILPLPYLVYLLIVVSVGGLGIDRRHLLLAASVLGIADIAGKYYCPELGAFVIYAVMVAVLLWRPHGPVRAAP